MNPTRHPRRQSHLLLRIFLWVLLLSSIRLAAQSPSPARILTQPVDVTVTAGLPATFRVGATGSPAVAYRWQVQGAGAADWLDVPPSFPWNGQASPELIVDPTTPEMNGSRFRCIVGNLGGGDTSQSATLTVNVQPVGARIIHHPRAHTVDTGGTAVFTVTAAGHPTPAYRWQVREADATDWVDVQNGASVRGQSTPSLSVLGVQAFMAGDTYRCIVGNSLGAATSESAVLGVTGPPHSGLTVRIEGEGSLTAAFGHSGEIRNLAAGRYSVPKGSEVHLFANPTWPSYLLSWEGLISTNLFGKLSMTQSRTVTARFGMLPGNTTAVGYYEPPMRADTAIGVAGYAIATTNQVGPLGCAYYESALNFYTFSGARDGHYRLTGDYQGCNSSVFSFRNTYFNDWGYDGTVYWVNAMTRTRIFAPPATAQNIRRDYYFYRADLSGTAAELASAFPNTGSAMKAVSYNDILGRAAPRLRLDRANRLQANTGAVNQLPWFTPSINQHAPFVDIASAYGLLLAATTNRIFRSKDCVTWEAVPGFSGASAIRKIRVTSINTFILDEAGSVFLRTSGGFEGRVPGLETYVDITSRSSRSSLSAMRMKNASGKDLDIDYPIILVRLGAPTLSSEPEGPVVRFEVRAIKGSGFETRAELHGRTLVGAWTMLGSTMLSNPSGTNPVTGRIPLRAAELSGLQDLHVQLVPVRDWELFESARIGVPFQAAPSTALVARPTGDGRVRLVFQSEPGKRHRLMARDALAGGTTRVVRELPASPAAAVVETEVSSDRPSEFFWLEEQ